MMIVMKEGMMILHQESQEKRSHLELARDKDGGAGQDETGKDQDAGGEGKIGDGDEVKDEAKNEEGQKENKGKGKGGKKKEGRRDQCKSKKFHEALASLPQSLQDHFNSLSRDQQTKFIHAGVVRSEGKLHLNHQAMCKMVTEREESHAGLQQMKGYGLEELGAIQKAITHLAISNPKVLPMFSCFRKTSQKYRRP